MPASVTFTCVGGAIKEQKFIYIERASFLYRPR